MEASEKLLALKLQPVNIFGTNIFLPPSVICQVFQHVLKASLRQSQGVHNKLSELLCTALCPHLPPQSLLDC